MAGFRDEAETDAAARPAAGEANAFAALMDQGRKYLQAGAWQGAAETFAVALALRPEDEVALEHVGLALMSAGRFAEADAYNARLRAIQARQLPRRLADGLAAIWQRTGTIEREYLEPAAVQWAWELADQSAWDKNAWLKAAAWGHEARLLMRRWWEAATVKQLDEIDDLIELLSLNEYRSALVERGGCILVGGHVGPTAAAVKMFHGGNWMFRPFGAAGFGRAHGTALMVVPNSIVTMRTLVKQVRDGVTIGLMADSPMARDRLAVEFLGRDVELPLQIPKLIQRYGTASFWCCPLWHNKRIRIELKRLPDPLADEPRDAWSRRWFAAYLENLETVMRGRPENLGLFSGIWSNVNPEVLRTRQQQAARIHRFAN